jgi:hypothetical protein
VMAVAVLWVCSAFSLIPNTLQVICPL